jgi:hypothetical protein
LIKYITTISKESRNTSKTRFLKAKNVLILFLSIVSHQIAGDEEQDINSEKERPDRYIDLDQLTGANGSVHKLTFKYIM